MSQFGVKPGMDTVAAESVRHLTRGQPHNAQDAMENCLQNPRELVQYVLFAVIVLAMGEEGQDVIRASHVQ